MYGLPMVFDWSEVAARRWQNALQALQWGMMDISLEWVNLALEAEANAKNPPDVPCPF